MCREFHRVMACEGPSHTTLHRYVTGKVKGPNVLTERYVQQAIHKLTVELSQKELSQSETQRKRVEKELRETEDSFRNLVEHTNDIWFLT